MLPLALVLLACSGEPPATEGAAWELPLPAWVPLPVLPAESPATPERRDYGEALFFARALSGNGSQSCADCHVPELAFADGRVVPSGSTGDFLMRNSPGLANVAWYAELTWANPLLTTLEDQLLVPMFSEHPVELGMTGQEDVVRARLSADDDLVSLGTRAFPDEDALGREAMVRALATYVRSLTSFDSPYDRFMYGGDSAAMSEEARLGLGLFNSERTECYHCHGGVTFSASFASENTSTRPDAFFNTGIYNIGGTGAYPEGNQGLYEITQDEADRGRFRAPSLRNVALTAPYMHDGSVATLAEVVDIYDRGGRLVAEGPYAGDGARHPNLDPLVRPIGLSPEERAQLVAFLESLSDPAFP